MMEEFIVVTMESKSRHTLYMESGRGNACKWTGDVENAIWFNTSREAQEFCDKYFKKFKDYKLDRIVRYI